MEHKTWLWRKKPSVKTNSSSEKGNCSSAGNEKELLASDNDQELEISVKNLNERLSCALSECNAKDDLVIRHMKVAEEAIAGWEKAEAEAECIKLELNDALQQRVVGEESLAHLGAALKECMLQLRFFHEEHEKRLDDFVKKTKKEFNDLRINLEEKLAKSSKRIAKLCAEKSDMSKFLVAKEKLIEDLKECTCQVEEDLEAIKMRLASLEKENISLRYEASEANKELEMREKERVFTCKSIDASHKQHLESTKKILMLETECQKLRLLVQQRLPGPDALAKMRNEVEILRKNATDRKKFDPKLASLIAKESNADIVHDSPSERTNFLIIKLSGVEKENRILKETLNKKNYEIQSMRTMQAFMASKLSQVESRLKELSKLQSGSELERSVAALNKMSFAPVSVSSNGDENNCSQSWASALLSELEHFQNGKLKGQSCTNIEASVLSLMDEFMEMERLAHFSIDKPVQCSGSPSDKYCAFIHTESDLRGRISSSEEGKEIVTTTDSCSNICDSNKESESKYCVADDSQDWIKNICMMILKQSCMTQKSICEIIDDVQITLKNTKISVPCEVTDAGKISKTRNTLDTPLRRDHRSCKPVQMLSFLDLGHGMNISSMGVSDNQCHSNLKKISNQHCHSNLNQSISKVIEVIEGIKSSLTDSGSKIFISKNSENTALYKDSTMPTDYTVRVFQWKSSELGDILHNFVQICNDLLYGKADLVVFARELSSTLDWVINHCFSIQDVSSMKYTIKKHFELDDLCSESELELGMNSPHSEPEKLNERKGLNRTIEASSLLLPSSKSFGAPLQMNKTQYLKLIDEINRLKDEIIELQSAKNDLEEMLRSTINKNEALEIQFRNSDQTVTNLQVELEKHKELEALTEDQIERLKLINEDLDTQLTVARIELDDARQKFSSLQVEFEDRSHFCEELDAKCVELQLNLESVTYAGDPSHSMDLEHDRLGTESQVSPAVEKLAECQETATLFEKEQSKASASPKNGALSNKMVIASSPTKINHRPSLFERMLADNDTGSMEQPAPKTKEIMCNVDPVKQEKSNVGLFYGRNLPSLQNANNGAITLFKPSPVKTKNKANAASRPLAIVPRRKRGSSGFWRLLMRKEKARAKKTSLSTRF